MRIEIYVDGAAMPNPGQIGYAAVLVAFDDDGNVLKRIVRSGYRLRGTNNQAEVLAATLGLQALQTPSEVTIMSDSQYLTQTMNDVWATKTNTDEFRTLRIVAMQHTVTWQWVKGHNGNAHNEMAHEAANRAIATKGQIP